jgi:hypothetical protein
MMAAAQSLIAPLQRAGVLSMETTAENQMNVHIPARLVHGVRPKQCHATGCHSRGSYSPTAVLVRAPHTAEICVYCDAATKQIAVRSQLRHDQRSLMANSVEVPPCGLVSLCFGILRAPWH